MDTTSHTLSPPNDHDGYYSIDVSPALLTIPKRILEFADNTDFTQKNEFHITVMGGKIIPLIEGAKASGEFDELLDEVKEWIMTPQNKYYLMAKKDTDGNIKQSIIQRVDMPAIEEFYGKLAKETILDVESPPPHITLFTKYSENGIALYSQDDFDNYLIRQIY
jgi:hypothetical protein